MTALDTNERNIPEFLRDAQQTARDDDTIRPILQQLKQTESAKLPGVQSALIVEPLDLSQARPKRSVLFPLLACTTVSAAVGIGLALFMSGWFEPKQIAEAAKPELNPRPVHTVSIKAEAPKLEERAAPAAELSLLATQSGASTSTPNDSNHVETVETRSQTAPDARELLTLWATMPSDLPSQASAAPSASAADDTLTADNAVAAARDNQHAAKPVHHRRVAHAQPRHHAKRSVARAANSRVAEASATTQESAARASSPNPLQSALQNIFGNNGSGNSSPAPTSAFRSRPGE